MKTRSKSIFNLFTLFAILALTIVPAASPVQAKMVEARAPVLQLTAGNSVIGFSPQKVYMASLRQTLIVEFVNANSVLPLSGSPAVTGMGKPAELSRVTYPNLWTGVEVRYERSAFGVLKSTYRLAAGAPVSAIGLRYNAPLKLDADGSLLIQLEAGAVSESAPIAWQVIQQKRVAVDVRFKLLGERQVGFALGTYDPRYEVVIDPTYRWHTFFGSVAGGDTATSVSVDGSGNVIVAGSSSETFNVGASAPKNAFVGGGGLATNIVVVKLDSGGNYLWHTFYGSGGVNGDFADGVSLDGSGNVVVAGVSSATFNVGASPPKNAYAGFDEIVVIKLDGNGNYLWHTFFGSTSADEAYDVSVDGSGNVVVAGDSHATFNVGASPPKNAYAGGVDQIVIVKLDGSGNYLWHTFYGAAGSGIENEARGVSVDGSGNVVVAGFSEATFNVGASPPKNAYAGAGAFNIVVIKLDSNGNYLWHTFHGSGSVDGDYAESVSVDGSGNVVVAGGSYATFNVGASPPKNAYTGGGDIVVIKLDGSGNYLWHTFFGSAAASDSAHGVSVDGSGNVVVAGESKATFNVGASSPKNAYAGGTDIVVVKLDGSGNYLWHTFHGSTSFDRSLGVSVDGNGDMVVAGQGSATFNVGARVPKNAYTGGIDIVVLKLSEAPIFADVPFPYWSNSYIESLYMAGITDGCGANPLIYCPDNAVTRAEMAVFLLKGIHGPSYTPPNATGTVFGDVPINLFAADWIEQLSAEGITAGCGNGNYCPGQPTSRAQMAVFLLKAKHGPAYTPPTATGVFADVPTSYWAAAWIEQLAAEGITGGCSAGIYCPDTNVTRAQMAVFLVKMFNLP